MRRTDDRQARYAAAQNGPQQGHGLARGESASDRDDGSIANMRRQIVESHPLVWFGVDGAWRGRHHAPPDERLRMRSAAFSAIMTVGACVLPLTIVGMIDASTTRNASTP